MKKTVALLSAAVMCFLLVACGGDTQSTDNNGIDGEDTANDVIVDDNVAQDDGQADNEDADNQNSDYPLLQFLYGEWEYTGEHADEAEFTKLCAYPDGTCSVDGEAGTWTVSDEYIIEFGNEVHNYFILVDIFTDGNLKGQAGIERNAESGTYEFAIISNVAGDYSDWKHTAAVTDDNDVALTIENWRNYFELIIEPSYSKNEFGEIESVKVWQGLQLKEEYADKVFATDVIYEVQATSHECKCNLNAIDGTYTFEATDKDAELLDSIIGKLDSWEIGLSTNYLYETESGSMTHLVLDMEDVNMLRIQGNLYFINE